MTGPRHDPVDDVSIVPGLGDVPAPRAAAPDRLDPALDPDRYDPARDSAVAGTPAAPLAGALDPALDPDRYDPARDLSDPTLPGLLGAGAFEDERNTYEWAYGLVVVVGFLALVSWIFGSVVSP